MIPGLTLKAQDGMETWETWGLWVSWEQEHFLSLCLPCQRKFNNTDYLLYARHGRWEGACRRGLALGEEGKWNQGANCSFRVLGLKLLGSCIPLTPERREGSRQVQNTQGLGTGPHQTQPCM